MTKLSRHERLKVTHAIEDTLENYCRSGCPFFGLNTPSEVCKTCPVSITLQEHGSKLWSEDELKPVVKQPWSKNDDNYLLRSRGKKKLAEIAEKLGRDIGNVDRRVRYLKDKGVIKS